MDKELLFVGLGFALSGILALILSVVKPSPYGLGLESFAIVCRRVESHTATTFPDFQKGIAFLFAFAIVEMVVEQVVNLDLDHRSLTLVKVKSLLVVDYERSMGELDEFVSLQAKEVRSWLLKRDRKMRRRYYNFIKSLSQAVRDELHE